MFSESLPEKPDQLLEYGYERFEEHTTDPCRWVRYRKRVGRSYEVLVFDIVIEYELSIYDDPFCTSEENRYYSFNEVRLVIYDRLQSDDDEEDADIRLVEIGEQTLWPDKLKDLEVLATVLGHRSD